MELVAANEGFVDKVQPLPDMSACYVCLTGAAIEGFVDKMQRSFAEEAMAWSA